MATIQLFPKDQPIVGIFRGFQQGGRDFYADLVLPYRNEFQNKPMRGQFLLIQLDTPNEAVLGRIASLSSKGKLSDGPGEEFSIRSVQEGRAIPEDLREKYLRYQVSVRVLGILRMKDDELSFVPSHRRLPNVGSQVAFPSDAVLQEIIGHNIKGALIGHLAFGEYVYAGDDERIKEQWMQCLHPKAEVRFPVESLVSRRSFIFARAGFGKSNLNKLLFSKLYESTPYVKKRGGKRVPVGTIIFDPDGEYFWPDDKDRPGLCDVPALEDKLEIFTDRKNQSPFYQSFVAGGIRLDIRRLKPKDVIGIALSSERQEQQNVRKLRGLPHDKWEKLVDLIDEQGNAAPIKDISELLSLDPQRQDAEAVAARSNMTVIVKMLHNKNSRLMDQLTTSLSKGKLCVVDVSQMRAGQSLILSGLILRRIFDRNQEEFTKAEPKTIPTIAVVEEAQSVLREGSSSSEPYIAWIKEGRKYDLGALLITQQPGSIPIEMLSQGDNWFIFHLLSSADITSLQRANAHFSDDLLGLLQNEPMPGHGVFWSSVGGKPYPISVRALLFESMFSVRDPHYDKPARGTGNARAPSSLDADVGRTEEAMQIGEEKNSGMSVTDASEPEEAMQAREDHAEFSTTEEDLNVPAMETMEEIEHRVINALWQDKEFWEKNSSEKGIPWGSIMGFFLRSGQLPEDMDDRTQFAYHLVKKAMEEKFGKQDQGWNTHRENSKTYIKIPESPKIEDPQEE